MGLKGSLTFAAVLIIGPVLAVVGYKHWLDTRTFNPIDIPVSLSRGHIRTPDFYINLTGEYYAMLDVDYPASYTPGCAEIQWRSLRTHSIAYQQGMNFGESDGPEWGIIGVLIVDKKGSYSYDVQVLSDGSCLNEYHPRLRVQNVSDFPYAYLYELGIWSLPLTTVAGLGLVVCQMSFAGYKQPTRTLSITESGHSEVTTGLPPRRLGPAKLISGLPHFPLVCATVLVVLVIVEMVGNAPYPSKGLYVSLHVRPVDTIAANSAMPPIVVLIQAVGKPPITPKVYVNSKPVEWNDLSKVLKEQMKVRPDWIVYIDGDTNLPFADIANVAGIAKELHARVALVTPETRKLLEPDLGKKKLTRR